MFYSVFILFVIDIVHKVHTSLEANNKHVKINKLKGKKSKHCKQLTQKIKL